MRIGSRGGHFVIMQGKKHYLKNPTPVQKGGESLQHVIRVFENVEDDEKVRHYAKRNKTPYMYYHEKKAQADQVKQLLSTMFPNEANTIANVNDVLDELYRMAEYGYSKVIGHQTVPSDAKVIVIGDVHGEIDPIKNTMVHWYEQGYISASGHLAENVYVVSTGDMVDYSTNSFDVVYAMLKLRSLNPEQVILLRGNHEGEWWVSGKHTLYDELSMKEILPALEKCFEGRKIPFVPQIAKWTVEVNMKRVYYPAIRGMYPEKTEDEIEKIVDDFIRNRPYLNYFLHFTALLRNIGQSMLLLKFEGDTERFAFMHGMWPMVNYSQKDEVLDVDIWHEDDDDPQTPLKHSDSCRPNYNMAIMWNDLSDGRDTYKSKRGIPYCVQVGSKDLYTIMEKNHVKAIVRGHQDLCHTQQGMIAYDANGAYTCANGVASTLMKECVHGKEPKVGWCESPAIYVHGTPTDESDAAQRVLTSSMAHWKSGGFACMGAYTVISRVDFTTNIQQGGQLPQPQPQDIRAPLIRGEETPSPHEKCERKSKTSKWMEEGGTHASKSKRKHIKS